MDVASDNSAQLMSYIVDITSHVPSDNQSFFVKDKIFKSDLFPAKTSVCSVKFSLVFPVTHEIVDIIEGIVSCSSLNRPVLRNIFISCEYFFDNNVCLRGSLSETVKIIKRIV